MAFKARFLDLLFAADKIEIESDEGAYDEVASVGNAPDNFVIFSEGGYEFSPLIGRYNEVEVDDAGRARIRFLPPEYEVVDDQPEPVEGADGVTIVVDEVDPFEPYFLTLTFSMVVPITAAALA
jgi:hypothetical protein